MPTKLSSNWSLEERPVASAKGRRAGGAADPFMAQLGSRFTPVHSFEAFSPRRRAAERIAPLQVTVPAEPKAAYVLALRHRSGAISFHAPSAQAARRGAAASAVTFEVDLPEPPVEGERRGLLVQVVKGTVLKVAGKIADLAMPFLARRVEERLWKVRAQGWLQVTAAGMKSGTLAPADFALIKSPSDRCLLLIHGTFSHAAGAYGGLAHTASASSRDFLTEAAALYGPRIYAFNHFSVSKTPEENARELVDSLPKQATFDVITHSRGGLVLRNLVERRAALGANADRFQLGHAVLVASPNEGTPLATPGHLDRLFSWWANLLELFPDNPFTTAGEFIAEGLSWIANHVVGSLPGLESMDMQGSMIHALNAAPSPTAGAYSALVSNYEPRGAVLARMLDAGMDGVFGRANDLVVPTEGGWRVDAPQTLIPAARIGCYGREGNIALAADVTHVTFFNESPTIDFLLNALQGRPQNLPALDPAKALPFRFRRSAEAVAAPGPAPAPAPTQAPPTESATPEVQAPMRAEKSVEADDVLHLFLLSMDGHLAPEAVAKMKERPAILLATFRNARVVETMYLRTEDVAKQHGWNEIIAQNEEIRSYVNGQPGLHLPNEAELRVFGEKLFGALFSGSIRRIYDLARQAAERDGRRLDIVITSMVNWIADKPWEFVFDPLRQTFLAAEDVNFTRNVLTAVPAQEIGHDESQTARPLRILVVVAQPIGLGLLSTDEEERVVRRGFQQLEQHGLAKVEVMLNAQVEELHRRLLGDDVDVVHFVGHGEFVEKEDQGYLLFENPQGGVQRVSAESLRQVLCHRGLRLVFLNACETGMPGREDLRLDFNRGVAPKLVSGGIPVVVANQYKVLDASATEFAQHFYWWLAHGATVGDAAREARVAVNYSIAGECIDWAVPVVFARNPSRRLFLAAETKHALAALKPRRRVTRAKGKTVGLWDVNHVVPGLEALVKRLNAAQGLYEFRAVDITAPIGTWRPQPTAKGGAVIRGKEVADKLRDQVSALGLDRIYCITTFTLANEDGEEGLTLWNYEDDQRFAIISGAGLFENMNDAYPLQRFLVNTLAAALNSTDDGHGTPPATCPNHFQAKEHASLDARLAYLTASQTFCARCRKQLKADELAALEQVLTTF